MAGDGVGMVVIVCGSREGARQRDVSDAIDAWHARRPVSVLIHGDCLDPGDEFTRPMRSAPVYAVTVEQAGGGYPDGLSVDACARRWGKIQRSLGRGTVVVHDMPADWYPERQGNRKGRLDRSAGPKRNRRMANELKRYRDAGCQAGA